jgi:hypothetical protein
LAIVLSVGEEMTSTNFPRNPSASCEPSAGFANDTRRYASNIARTLGQVRGSCPSIPT